MSFKDFNINSMVLRYVVPFYFEPSSSDGITVGNSEYERISEALTNSMYWVPETLGKSEKDTFEYIQQSVLKQEGDSNIGESWLYEGKKLKFRYASDVKHPNYYYWDIKQLGVYIFRTNVGFLWYEIVPAENTEHMDISEFMLFQNRFKELCRNNPQYSFQKEIEEGIYKSLFLGSWLSNLLKELSNNIHFNDRILLETRSDERAEVSKLREVPDKAVIFNYMLIEPKENIEKDSNELCGMAYLLANGYTEKYKISESTKKNILEPFDEVCWYASKGGCGYYAFLCEDNKKFFGSGLMSKIKNDYFLMHILALHQSYSVDNYMRRISYELSANPKKYLIVSEDGERLDRLVTEINTFLMKGMYLSVSHVQHQNLFFEYLQKALKIQEDVASINMGSNALVKLQRIRRDKEEDYRDFS